MQDEPTGSERPGDQQPAAGQPTPPPPQPGAPPPPGGGPPPPPGGGPQAPPQGDPQAPPQGDPPPSGGPGYPGPGQPYPSHGGYPPPPRRLTRRTDNRVFAGVASGLGAYFGVDPVIFRIGFVALTLVGGTGLLIYLLLWAVLPAVSYGAAGPPPGPASGDPPILAALRQGGVKSYLAIGAAILAVLLLAGQFAHGTVVFALLLIGVGLLLMVQDRPDQATGSASPWPPGPPPPPTGGGQQPGEQSQQRGAWPQAPQPPQGGQGAQSVSGDPSQAAYATATQPGARDDTVPGWEPSAGWSPGERGQAPSSSAAQGAGGYAGSPSGGAHAGSPSGWGAAPTSVIERRRRPRSVLGWLTVAAALVATGLASALDNLGVVHLTPTRIVALVLTVIGVGLLVGSLWGRAWWLVLLGLLLVPVMAVASVASDVPVRGRTGEQVERPQALIDVQSEYRLSAGQFTLDLGQVDFGSRPRLVRVRMGAGDMNVIVPRDQPVTVTSWIGAGELNVLGRPSNGGFQVRDTVHEDGAPGAGRLTLDLHLGVGQIVVKRGP